jgi:hypothetical protein
VNRQSALNDLYAAYRDAGDDDMNARCRIREDIAELLDAAVQVPEAVTNLELFLREARPVTAEELDAAEAAYYEEEE